MRITTDMALAWADDAATLALIQDSEATPALLSGLKTIGFPGNLGMPPGDESKEVFSATGKTVAALPDAPDTVFMDGLAADYAAIYLTGAFEASPYESFWLSDEHLICQEPMFELRSLYAADGLVVPDWRKRPDDHLVFQLQFLARRLERIAIAADAADEQWRSLARLMDFHLLRWLSDFANRVASRCETEFYAALLLLTDHWCAQLRQAIAEHLGEPRPSREEIEASLQPRRLEAGEPVPVSFVPGIGGPSW